MVNENLDPDIILQQITIFLSVCLDNIGKVESDEEMSKMRLEKLYELSGYKQGMSFVVTGIYDIFKKNAEYVNWLEKG
jgi:hypothetical protein